MSKYSVPLWKRYALTIPEAAAFYHIGETKLRNIVDEHPNDSFAILNGNRVLIKREKFEEYLDTASVI